MSADAIGDQVRNVNTRLDFRHSAGLLNTKEKFGGGILGGIMSGGEKAWNGTREGASDVWNATSKVAGDYWNKNGELITNGAICELEATAVILALPAILAMSAGGAAIAIGIAAIIGASYSANTLFDSGLKIYEKNVQGKAEKDCTGFNVIQTGIQQFTGNEEKAKEIYDVSALGVAVLTLGIGGGLMGAAKLENIAALKAACLLEKSEPLIKDANKVGKLTLKYSNLAKQNEARIIAHANKVAGASSKETRAFRQAKKSYDASIEYTDIQKGITKNRGIITENFPAGVVGAGAVATEETLPKGIKAFNELRGAY